MSSTSSKNSILDADTAAAAAKVAADIIAASRHDDPERADLLTELATARHFLRYTLRGLTDEQAAQRTTASELCLGGLIKHCAAVERNWASFIVHGAAAAPSFSDMTPEDWAKRADQFRMLPGETLQGVLADYEKAAAATDDLVRTADDLGVEHALPDAPWFPPGVTWSVRRVILHVISETAQHAGHADIIRESLDGAKSMG
ncbi:MAG: DinB family protein [Nocardiopsaceae bacterium]|nr:DinB family protein [Nocardiopsaceae bacterium]